MAALAGGVLAERAMKRKSGGESSEPVLPDEEELKRQNRREAAKRFGKGGTGRVSTMMTTNG